MRPLLMIAILCPLATAYLPVVLWHGVADSCCGPTMLRRTAQIEAQHPGTYVDSIITGWNPFIGTRQSFFDNMNDQVERVCKKITNNPLLANGFHAVGFSQGGLFLRALVQRCPGAKVRNLVSIGGQQQGIFGLPLCDMPGFIGKYCNKAAHLIATTGAYEAIVQNMVIAAQYWHDPNGDESLYRSKSIFLADVNQENGINPLYRERMMNLTSLVLVTFEQDHFVIPRESQWFGYYTPGQSKEITNMTNSALYTEDRIGLKFLNEQNRIHFLSVDAGHLQMPAGWFEDNIINKFLD